MTELDAEDNKLVVLARGAMARAEAAQGAAVRDLDGRTYAGAPVTLAALTLTALQAALKRHRTRRSAYETARVYGWMATAHRALGAHDLAATEEAAAAELYRKLGIQPPRGR